MKVSASTLSRAAAKLRLHGELKLADALAPRKSLKAPKSKRGARVAKAAKRETRRGKIARIREAVRERADGQCEAQVLRRDAIGFEVWYRCQNSGSILDHWLGGSGRRQAFESVETTWFLCEGCNGKRGANDPSAAHWNEAFEEHCVKHGYAFTPHITRDLSPRTP